MNQLKVSVIAKVFAWMLCVVSLMGIVLLGFLTVIGIDGNLFYKTHEEALEEIYQNVNAEYSLNAYSNRDNSSYTKSLAEQHFKFGIIKADSLKEINFQDKLSYLQTNMTAEEIETINKEELFLYQITEQENGSIYGTKRGYYGDYEDISELDAVSENLRGEYMIEQTYLYADRICYDTIGGILYYRAENNYYPVQNVSLQYYNNENPYLYNYSYDFAKKGYRFNYARPIEDNGDSVESTEEPQQHEYMEADDTQAAIQHSYTESDYIETILRGEENDSIVNLAQLNSTDFNYNCWGVLILDNIRYIDSQELTLIDSNNISQEYFIEEPGYYLDENYTLVVESTISSSDYWVVSLVPESAPQELTNSRYYQYGWMIDKYYDIDNSIIQWLVLCAFVAIVSFGFLACAAGHRRNREDIVLTFVDRIPLEILSFVVCIGEVFILLLCFEVWNSSGIRNSTDIFISLLGIAVLLMIVIATEYLLSLCVRIKSGKWWRNTICYWIYSHVRDMVLKLYRNINFLWKLILITGIVSLLEFWVIAETSRNFIVMAWIVEKLVICVIVFGLAVQMRELQKASLHMAEGDLAYKADTAKMFWECKKHGENLNKISEGMAKAVDERMKSERFKTELITNVSHDIKTPLTSIINYVDLLEKEEINNEKASEYLEVLDRQSSKLKKLIEDLVEASKAASGSLAVDNQPIEAGVFITQTVGEFAEKLSDAGLELIVNKTQEPVYIMADGRHLWRVVDNLMNNVCKYAQPNSRVYVNLEVSDRTVSIVFKNMSKYPLNISGEELMERFVRGDKSRNTQGHGLGLSIAQSLMKLIGGDIKIVVDGDLFKAELLFDRYLTDISGNIDKN